MLAQQRFEPPRRTVIGARRAVQLDGHAVGHQPHGVLDAFVAQRIEPVHLDEGGRQAGKALGIALLDHIIVARKGAVSMRVCRNE